MKTARVIRPFISNGEVIEAGAIIRFAEDTLQELAGLVEVIDKDMTEAELLMQQNASDFTSFCMAHELTMPDCRCTVKHNRLNPMTNCLGWQLKIKRTVN